MTYVFTSGNNYSFQIVSTDNAGNVTTSACSPGINIDNVPPVDPARMEWTQSPGPTNAATIVADWDVSSSGDLNDQEIQFYTGTCAAPFGPVIPLLVTDTNASLSGLTSSTTYSYQINSIDNSGNSSFSACSSTIVFDNVNPPAVSDPVWGEGSFATSVSLNANWTASNENVNGTDTQTIEIYENNACSGAVHFTTTLAGPAVATFNYTAGTDGNTYHFKILTADASGNVDTASACSAGVKIDLTNPIDPTLLAWNLGNNPTNNLSVTASWNNGGEGDILNQTIQFYTGASCTSGNEDGAAIVIAGSGTTTQPYLRAAGPLRTVHSYDVLITDTAGRTSNTICVTTPMTIDDEDPTSPVLTGWDEAPLTNSATITARWTVSTSTDVTSQLVNYYSIVGCGGASLGTSFISDNTSVTSTFTGGTGSTYYFNVTSEDDAGNTVTSPCIAAGVTIDLDPPADGTALGWVQTNPSNVALIEADWTISGSADIADQEITYYANATCGSPILSGPTSVGIGTDNDQSQTATHGTQYSYTITSIDAAGNSTTSGCSTSLEYDNVGPTAVATGTLLWDEVIVFQLTLIGRALLLQTYLLRKYITTMMLVVRHLKRTSTMPL